jgi:hypothetical protein
MQRLPMRAMVTTALIASLTILGCGSESGYDASPRRQESFSLSTADKQMGLALPGPAETAADSDPAAAAAQSTTTAEQFVRKLIYTADARLVVEQFDPVPASIEELVRKHRGYIANSKLGGTRGTRRSGTWQVRVPTDQFEAFLSATAAIGEVQSLSRGSQDVTEEFFDIEARIRNKAVQEKGLLKILEERGGKLEDVLAVERELSRVREEMERMQGRLRLLANLTSLATVNISVEEIKNYVPEQAPTFSRRLARSFGGSLAALQRTGENAMVALVAVAPWLVSLLVLGLPIAAVTRWSLSRGKPPASL